MGCTLAFFFYTGVSPARLQQQQEKHRRLIINYAAPASRAKKKKSKKKRPTDFFGGSLSKRLRGERATLAGGDTGSKDSPGEVPPASAIFSPQGPHRSRRKPKKKEEEKKPDRCVVIYLSTKQKSIFNPSADVDLAAPSSSTSPACNNTAETTNPHRGH